MPPIENCRSFPRVLIGLPHRLAKVGIAGRFVNGLLAEIVFCFIDATILEEPDSGAIQSG